MLDDNLSLNKSALLEQMMDLACHKLVFHNEINQSASSVNLRKSYLDLYSTYVTYVTHGMQLCAAKHNKEKKSISTLLISLICLTDLF